MARKRVSFDLTEEERATLSMWVTSHKTEQRLSRRAQVILLSERGMTLREISQESRLSEKNCLKWRKRFLKDRVDGLKDAPRKGRPSVITPWQRAQVIRLACERPLNGSNAWSVRELARVTGLGSTSVHRILNEVVGQASQDSSLVRQEPRP